MGKVDIPQIEPKGNRTTDEYVHYLANMLAIIQEELQNFLEGRISSENMREIAGYNVSQTELKHKSGIVGMSGADAATATAIRFWAGNADKTAAPFRVQQNGKMYATDGEFEGKITATDIEGGTITGALIQTAAAGIFPRIEFSDTGELIGAYYSATNFVKLLAVISGNPGFRIDNGDVSAQIGNSATEFVINTVFGFGNIYLQSGADLKLFADGLVRFQDWDKMYSNGDGQTLQTALNNKAPIFAGFTGSIPPGATIHVDNGVIEGYSI